MKKKGSKVAVTSRKEPMTKPDSRSNKDREHIRIGVIGLSSARAVSYGKLFNGNDLYSDVEVQYLWTGKEDQTRITAEKGNIPYAVKDPLEMLGEVNALILGHDYSDYFLNMALPFLKERIPVFVPAPFCNRLEEAKEFLQVARAYSSQVTSYSPVAYSETTFSLMKRVKLLGKINQVIGYGPADVYAEHGDIYDHVVHMVQSLMMIFGDDIEFVRVSTAGKKGSASLTFHSGLFATLIFKRQSFGWETFVETDSGIAELVSYVKEVHPLRYYADMIEMFRTAIEPVSHERILRCVAVLEALERSIHTQNWEEIRD